MLDLPTTIQDIGRESPAPHVNATIGPCVKEAVRARAKGQGLDEIAIREFLASDYPRLVAAVALISGSRPAAEDAVQEALARAWERSERGERIESLPAWVTTVATNLVRSGLRRLRAERRVRNQAVDAPAGAPIEQHVDIGRALRSLPRRQREATVLRYYLDMDVEGIARILAVSEGTVKTSLYRARRALATALAEPVPEEANDPAGP